MREYDAASGGPLYLYLFREAYDNLADGMTVAAEKDGFHFVNIENLYDRVVRSSVYRLRSPHCAGIMM